MGEDNMLPNLNYLPVLKSIQNTCVGPVGSMEELKNQETNVYKPTNQFSFSVYLGWQWKAQHDFGTLMTWRLNRGCCSFQARETGPGLRCQQNQQETKCEIKLFRMKRKTVPKFSDPKFSDLMTWVDSVVINWDR